MTRNRSARRMTIAATTSSMHSRPGAVSGDTVIFDEGTIKTRKDQNEASNLDTTVTYVLTAISWIFVALTMPFSIFMCIKIAKEYERAVIFRLGSLIPGRPKGPGVFFILPCIDKYRLLDLRVMSYDVPPQEILSKDSVTVTVDAVIYFRTSNPIQSVTNVNDAFYSTKLIAQSTLRNVLGMKTLSEMLSDRESIALMTMRVLDEATDKWGVKVERVEMKNVLLPMMLMRSMAAEAEATRDARAQFIHSEGERQASAALKSAADIINSCPTALKLRALQTMCHMASEHPSTILFPVPMQCVLPFARNRPPQPHRRKRSRSPPGAYSELSKEMFEQFESVLPTPGV